jgi:hypothetical protein
MTSTIKVNNVQNQCGQNIINENSNTITIGASGDTIALASGASQSGFGRTGTVDWQTSIKTAASFTAVNGEGYFVDTSSNAVTANLPAGVVGAIVAFKDYAQNFDTNSLTVSANGSEKIEGQTFDLILDQEGQGVTLVYGDATKGWQAVNSNEIANTQKFVTATGGNAVLTCSDFKIHVFTGPGTFCVSCAGNPTGSTTVDYMVVAGGGGGGGHSSAGGGGGGGFRESPGAASGCYTASPLGASPAVALPVSVQGYSIAVGGGGAGGPGSSPGLGTNGAVSTFSTITSAGGGGGGAWPSPDNASPGGSGGGAGNTNTEGTGNQPPVNPPQGQPGQGGNNSCGGGGGGGATAAGSVGSAPNNGGPGGAGATTAITTSSSYGEAPPTPGRAYAGGGGGRGGGPATRAQGGLGGGGNGNLDSSGGDHGTTNTGGGGGGNGSSSSGANGGSGIVIIRYKFQ